MLDGRAEISRPGPESVLVDGVAVGPGSRVVLRPRTAASDVLMRSVDGRRAIVEAVLQDTEDEVKLTVTLEDDPIRSLGKARGLGHRFFFAADELEPLPSAGAGAPPRRALVAGIGNVFLGDDGFGVAVVRALATRPNLVPEGVDVVEFGIRGMDLAYALNDGYHAAVLIDAAPRGQPPGTLELIEPEIEENLFAGFATHGMDPVAVLALARQFGPVPDRLLLLGCEPAHVIDTDREPLREELSAPVAAAIPRAVALLGELLAELVAPADDDNQRGER
jgi:hydrogenase maturation protease